MRYLLIPALVVTIAAGVGAAIERLLRFASSPADLVSRWSGRVLTSFAFLFLWVLWPPLAIGLMAALFLARPVAASERTAAQPLPWSVRLAVAVLAVVIASRGHAMIYWDENTHLARAAWGASGFSAIRTASLDSSPFLLQRGYPIFWPLTVAALSGMSGSSPALLAAAAVALFTLGALFAGVSADQFRGSAFAPVPVVLLLLTPFALVHARSAYADLPLGLLAACWAMLLSRGRMDALAIVLGVSVAGLKDEGLAVAVAAAGSVGWDALRGARSRASLPGIAAAFLPIAIWKWWFPSSGVASAGHTVAAMHWDRLGEILVQGFFRHAADLDTWGLVWPMYGGALLSMPWVWARLHRDTQFLAVFCGLHLAALAGAIVVGPADVIDHVTVYGFVANRLLIQALPSVLVLLTCVVRDLSMDPRVPHALPDDASAASSGPRPARCAATRRQRRLRTDR